MSITEKIYKYELEIVSIQTIEMPKNARIINAAGSPRGIFIWAIIDTREDVERVTFEVVNTGYNVDTVGRTYINTIINHDGFVWHLFKRNF